MLDLIRFTPGGISRADLARQLQISRSAVTTIVNDLLIMGVVREANSGPATGGRRPIMLEINPKQGYVVGVDMGASHLSIALADFSARILEEIEAPHDISQGPEAGLGLLDSQLQQVLAAAGIALHQVLSVGMGVPGPVVTSRGSVIEPPLMPGWDTYPIRAHLESRWKLPVLLNNDAELGALGEWAYGAGRGEGNLIFVKVGSGIGAGLMFDGGIYRGVIGTAGEIGHITIDPQGPVCACGNRGCLEALAGGYALARRAREAVLSGERTRLAAIRPVELLTAKDVSEAAQLGDLVAQRIVTQTGEYLGTAIANLVNLFNPGLIVIGGGLANMGDLLLEPIRQTVKKRSLKAAAQSVRITAAVLGRRATTMGAVVQALTVALPSLMGASEEEYHR